MNEQPVIDSGAARILSLAEETKFAANGIVSRTLLRTATRLLALLSLAVRACRALLAALPLAGTLGLAVLRLPA